MPRVMSIRLIVNADDFGLSGAVNTAVAKAYEFGTLTSASLMVTGEAVSEAVAIARGHPSLAVGLHLVLSRACSILLPEQIPALVDSHSRFRGSPVRAGFRYYFSTRARTQLAAEIDAQFQAFAETGLTFSHVDGHQHLHAHPVVVPTVVRLAEQYGASGVRVPREPHLLHAVAASLYPPTARLMAVLGQACLARASTRALSGSPLVRCDYCIGGLVSGQMTDACLIDSLQRIRQGTVEAYSHPSTCPSSEPFGPNPGDLQALLSPRLEDYIKEHCDLATYPSLAHQEGA